VSCVIEEEEHVRCELRVKSVSCVLKNGSVWDVYWEGKVQGWPKPYIFRKCTYRFFCKKSTIGTVIYGADIRFWPTLKNNVLGAWCVKQDHKDLTQTNKWSCKRKAGPALFECACHGFEWWCAYNFTLIIIAASEAWESKAGPVLYWTQCAVTSMSCDAWDPRSIKLRDPLQVDHYKVCKKVGPVLFDLVRSHTLTYLGHAHTHTRRVQSCLVPPSWPQSLWSTKAPIAQTLQTVRIHVCVCVCILVHTCACVWVCALCASCNIASLTCVCCFAGTSDLLRV
jgi:hypothetical protein